MFPAAKKRIDMRVLLIEDDALLAALLEASFRQEQLALTPARDAATALQEVGMKSYDLILLDLGLSAETVRLIDHRTTMGHSAMIPDLIEPWIGCSCSTGVQSNF